jgi:phosphoglycolate phosphatase/putative hydrolase of the HAD superfamily
MKINWSKIKVVIFDVDGTLYDQRKLRRYMLKKLIGYYIVMPQHLRELKVLRDFRREREKRAFYALDDIESDQYNWGAQASGVSPEIVRSVVEKWIFNIPLQHIPYCRYPGVLGFFDNLCKRGIATAIFSDYPAKEKMAALGLSPNCIVCSTDRNVDRLKPDPKGLFVIAETLGISVEHCLFIGDRDERDGECARKARMPYLIMKRGKSRTKYQFNTYLELIENLSSYS